nr:hypothetical protein TetV2_00477 [Oceanusvirus sp.]
MPHIHASMGGFMEFHSTETAPFPLLEAVGLVARFRPPAWYYSSQIRVPLEDVAEACKRLLAIGCPVQVHCWASRLLEGEFVYQMELGPAAQVCNPADASHYSNVVLGDDGVARWRVGGDELDVDTANLYRRLEEERGVRIDADGTIHAPRRVRPRSAEEDVSPRKRMRIV